MSGFAENLKKLRIDRGYVMQVLADRASVSKSMISKIERGEVQPTLDVAARLAQALGKSLSEMLHAQSSAQIVLTSKAERPIWQDPHSQIKRYLISPTFVGASLDWVRVELSAGAATGILPPLQKEGEKFIYVLAGQLEIIIDNDVFKLNAGDSLYFVANNYHEIKNTAKKTADYFVICKYA